jgi:hypothetical protein
VYRNPYDFIIKKYPLKDNFLITFCALSEAKGMVIIMKKDNIGSFDEIKAMLKILIDDNKKLLASLQEIKEEQKKLHEEIRIQNIVLNSLPIRTEIIN